MATTDTPLLTPELLAQLERLELVSRKIFRGRIKGEPAACAKGRASNSPTFAATCPGTICGLSIGTPTLGSIGCFLKLFLEEEDLHFYALIDASESMAFGTPSKLEFAKRLAAALGFIGLIRSDRVKIETLGQSSARPALRCVVASVWRMVDYINDIQPGETTSLAEGIKNFCLRNTGRGIVVVISDMLDKHGYEEGLRF